VAVARYALGVTLQSLVVDRWHDPGDLSQPGRCPLSQAVDHRRPIRPSAQPPQGIEHWQVPDARPIGFHTLAPRHHLGRLDIAAGHARLDQRCLANTGLTRDEQHLPLPASGTIEDSVHLCHLGVPTHQSSRWRDSRYCQQRCRKSFDSHDKTVP
jgi:hypothetical protein